MFIFQLNLILGKVTFFTYSSQRLCPLVTFSRVTCSEWNAPGLPRAVQSSHDPGMPLIHGFSIDVSGEKAYVEIAQQELVCLPLSEGVWKS